MSEHTPTREEVLAEADRFEAKAKVARANISKVRPARSLFWTGLAQEHTETARILRALAPPPPALEPLTLHDVENLNQTFEATYHPEAGLEPFSSYPVHLLVTDARDKSRWSAALLSLDEVLQLRDWLNDALSR